MNTPPPEATPPPLLTMEQVIALHKKETLPPVFRFKYGREIDNWSLPEGCSASSIFKYLERQGWRVTTEVELYTLDPVYIFSKLTPQKVPVSTESIILDFAIQHWGEKTMAGRALKLGEESGEVQGAVSKIEENRATEADLDDEMGDVLIVLSQMAAMRGTTLEALRSKRFEFIKDRAVKEHAQRQSVFDELYPWVNSPPLPKGQ